MSRSIEIRGLKLQTFIGVPDEERSASQELRLTVSMTPALSFREMEDRIELTADYAAAAVAIQDLALSQPRRLIETLAEDIADYLLENYPVTEVSVHLEKFILPQTDCVAVRLTKAKSQPSGGFRGF